MATKIPRYKVVSEDGRTFGTKIIDLETGEPIRQVTKIVLRADVNDLWRAEIHLIGVAVDVSVMETMTERVFAPLPQAEEANGDG